MVHFWSAAYGDKRFLLGMAAWTAAQCTRVRVETAFFLTIQQVGRWCISARSTYVDLRVVLAMCRENPAHRDGLLLSASQRKARRSGYEMVPLKEPMTKPKRARVAMEADADDSADEDALLLEVRV